MLGTVSVLLFPDLRSNEAMDGQDTLVSCDSFEGWELAIGRDSLVEAGVSLPRSVDALSARESLTDDSE